MAISFYKALTRNPEIGNNPWSFAQYLESGASKNIKFGTNVFNKMLLNAAKCQGYSFYRFWIVIIIIVVVVVVNSE